MKRKTKHILLGLFVFAVIATLISCATLGDLNFFSRTTIINPSAESELILVQPQDQEIKLLPAEANMISTQTNLVVITHGWIENTTWPGDVALAIAKIVDTEQWACGWFDWRKQAMVLNPTDTAKYGKQKAAPILAEKILALSNNFNHIHLIGHSAGSWVINESANILTKQTDATIHLTFLDAFIPPFWRENELGEICSDPNVSCWAEHYFTRDITLGATETLLSNAHNVELTSVNPGLNSHKFPWHWYYATVLGKYAPDQRYQDNQLYYISEGIDYGFERSLEAGLEHWQKSTTLKPNTKPVKIKPD